MFCTRCGFHIIDNSALFCTNCGAKIAVNGADVGFAASNSDSNNATFDVAEKLIMPINESVNKPVNRDDDEIKKAVNYEEIVVALLAIFSGAVACYRLAPPCIAYINSVIEQVSVSRSSVTAPTSTVASASKSSVTAPTSTVASASKSSVTAPTSTVASAKRSSFTDSRDGKTYKTVKMPDGKTWMAENLNYQTRNSWCYDNNESYCNKYGRLYDWNTAKKVCPTGWHLPSRQEWNNLGQSVGGKRSITGDGYIIKWEGAGKKLKSTTGWNYYKGQSGNGTDDFGFSALPGGVLVVGYHSTWQNDGDGNWWTATESETSGYDPELCGAHCAVPDEYNAYRQRMSYFDGDIYESDFGTSSSFSVRCVHN